MKKILLILLLVSSFLFAENQEYKIIDTKQNKEVKLLEMAELLGNYDVIFFGEFHDNTLLHKLEYELLKTYYRLNKNLIVSFEMFERDVQPVLDQYLNNNISEEDFLIKSRPWSNYETDYKPLLDFAKNNNLTAVAANIPRRYASMINKQGLNALDSLSIEEKKFVARKHKVFEDEYKERFMQMMHQNMAHMPNSPMAMKMDFEALYAAQCIKDDTMAESILRYQRILPRRKVIHFNGDFHSRKHLGTAQKLQLIEPMLKIAVITPIICEGDFKWDDEDLLEGEFLILLKDNNTEE